MDFSDLPRFPLNGRRRFDKSLPMGLEGRGSSESPSSMVAPPSNANTLSLQR